MLAIGGDGGWGVYVAIERVTGTLHGRSGSFVLYHNGTMTPAGQRLEVTVAPESGTGELAGLTGKMAISFPMGNIPMRWNTNCREWSAPDPSSPAGGRRE
jgi:hypothetical protein